MSRLIPAAERIKKARALIGKARALPPPDGDALGDFSYVAQVKDILRQARDLVKFISYSAGSSGEVKREAESVLEEARHAESELLKH